MYPIEKLLFEDKLSDGSLESPYEKNGKSVPRVTAVLNEMLGSEQLISWANRLGLYNRMSHLKVRDRAANIGTHIHSRADAIIKGLPIKDSDMIEVVYGTESFALWWNLVSYENTINCIAMEKKMTCDYFGGTIDLLLDINGRHWLIDIKSGNTLSFKHHLQLGAYKYMLNADGINIDGCCILQISKKSIKFREEVIDLGITEMNDYMNKCVNLFLSLAYSYHRKNEVEKEYTRLFAKTRWETQKCCIPR
jgi:hypothetical protein